MTYYPDMVDELILSNDPDKVIHKVWKKTLDAKMPLAYNEIIPKLFEAVKEKTDV